MNKKKVLCVHIEGNDFTTIVEAITEELTDYVRGRKWHFAVPRVIDRQGKENLSCLGWDLGIEIDLHDESGKAVARVSDIVDIVSFCRRLCGLRHINMALFIVNDEGRNVSETRCIDDRTFDRKDLESLVKSL